MANDKKFLNIEKTKCFACKTLKVFVFWVQSLQEPICLECSEKIKNDFKQEMLRIAKL